MSKPKARKNKKSKAVSKSAPTREELLVDLKRVASEFSDAKITRNFYRAHGQYSEGMWGTHFPRFIDFLTSAGLDTKEESKPENNLEEADSEILYKEDYIYNPTTDTYITFLDRSGVRIQLSGSQHRAMKDSYSNWTGKPETINEICRTFGMRRDWFMEYKSMHGWTHDSEPVTNEELIERSEDDMVQDMLQKKKLSLFRNWEKAKWNEVQKGYNKWMNLEQNILLPLTSSIEKYAPNYKPPMLNLPKADEPFAVVIAPFDLHYGKYGWEDEVGQGYSRAEARELLLEHTENLAGMIAKFGKPDKIICASGSDYLHVDNPHQTTTRGTPQDVDGTRAQIFTEGCELAVEHVDLMRQIAPVEWYKVPGNHDYDSAFSVMMYLSAWYKDASDVTIMKNPARRQYTTFGNTLLGFEHGDGVKVNDLHAIMTSEAKDKWVGTDFRYFFTGHLHHEVIREIHGLTAIQLKSLSGLDRFHSHHGYITSGRALQGFVITKTGGITAQLVSAVKGDKLFGVKERNIR